MDGVFLGQRGNGSSELLGELIASLTCSLWLVPHQTSVRRIVHIQSEPPSGQHTAHFAELLSRRLEVDLVTQSLSDLRPMNGRIPMARIQACVEESGADLLLLDRGDHTLPLRELSHSPPCLTVCLTS